MRLHGHVLGASTPRSATELVERSALGLAVSGPDMTGGRIVIADEIDPRTAPVPAKCQDSHPRLQSGGCSGESRPRQFADARDIQSCNSTTFPPIRSSSVALS